MSVMTRTKESWDCTAQPSKLQPGLCTDFPVISLTLQKLSPVFHVTDFFFFWMANFDCFISFNLPLKGRYWCYSHFTNEKTQAERYPVLCPQVYAANESWSDIWIIRHSGSNPWKAKKGSWRKISSLFPKFLDWWEPKETVVLCNFVTNGNISTDQKVVTTCSEPTANIKTAGRGLWDDGRLRNIRNLSPHQDNDTGWICLMWLFRNSEVYRRLPTSRGRLGW